jgi:cell division transport system permease protein
MSIAYTFKESFSGFKRAKLSSFISTMTICISLLLLGVFAIITVNATRFINVLRDKVEMEAFLQEPMTQQDLSALRKRISAIEGVEKIIYVSKDEAAKLFKEEFGQEISDVLDFNPLPASFKILLKDGYKTSVRAHELYDRLTAIKEINSVVYRKALLELIDERTASVNNLTLGLGVLISLSAIFLVSNTIRLAIYAKRQVLRTMELVGATSGFIRFPFLLEGILQGFAGGVIAASLLFVLIEYSSRLLSVEFSGFIHMEPFFYLLVVCAGIALGLIGSVISVVRFIRLTSLIY